MAQLEHIEAIERRLWGAADQLRANSNYASNEYFLPVMGLVFLRHAYSRYLAVKDTVEAGLPTRGGKTRALAKEDFSQQSAIFLRPEAQFDHLVSLPDSDDRAKAIIAAIIQKLHEVIDEAIETRQDQRGKDSEPYDISRIDFDRLKQEFERSPRKKTTAQNLRQALEQRLQRMLAQNPLRTNFQQHYEKIVKDYNREKDRVTIEKTFEELLRLTQELDKEEKRAVRKGLDMESLAIFDLLNKPELQTSEITKIKSIAVDLLATLKEEKLHIDQWRDKEATRDAVKGSIRDYLYGDEKGLPVTCYSEEEVIEKADNVFRHVYRAYPTLPSPYYQDAAVA